MANELPVKLGHHNWFKIVAIIMSFSFVSFSVVSFSIWDFKLADFTWNRTKHEVEKENREKEKYLEIAEADTRAKVSEDLCSALANGIKSLEENKIDQFNKYVGISKSHTDALCKFFEITDSEIDDIVRTRKMLDKGMWLPGSDRFGSITDRKKMDLTDTKKELLIPYIPDALIIGVTMRQLENDISANTGIIEAKSLIKPLATCRGAAYNIQLAMFSIKQTLEERLKK